MRQHLSSAGKKGGSSKSAAKATASRQNLMKARQANANRVPAGYKAGSTKLRSGFQGGLNGNVKAPSNRPKFQKSEF